ncbi:DUF6445 family protein [Streptomyces sp. NPDC005385]|uniref:DUF6445 family protein n=1 Tax=Streptomyces sp. NPDC005385 TaxID=3157039 RepID=UPI0033AA7745
MQDRTIVVDNFYVNPGAVRERALRSQYADISPTDYPGFASRTTIDAQSLRQRFAGLVGAELNVDTARFTWGGFRFITEVSARKSKVHADTAVDWAGMVYLTPDAPMNAGTGFFRHRPSGFATPPTDRQARALGYCDAAQFDDEVIRQDKADLTQWELIGQVEPVYNRLVLFRGGEQYHAPMGGCGDSPGTARLTHIFFFNVVPDLGVPAHQIKEGALAHGRGGQ